MSETMYGLPEEVVFCKRCIMSNQRPSSILPRDERIALERQCDGERPTRYLQNILDYIQMSEDEFNALVDKFRPPHLWEKINGTWMLKHSCWDTNTEAKNK